MSWPHLDTSAPFCLQQHYYCCHRWSRQTKPPPLHTHTHANGCSSSSTLKKNEIIFSLKKYTELYHHLIHFPFQLLSLLLLLFFLFFSINPISGCAVFLYVCVILWCWCCIYSLSSSFSLLNSEFSSRRLQWHGQTHTHITHHYTSTSINNLKKKKNFILVERRIVY